ncbi:M23 family metallopeptidase [Agromyces sp. M3QZ16-3]|uniref:M23 family metallopeptidase n=1 Tax=Agromyces sp. M3QZ16-3 TaxID=3447585 RepID=UPI003F68F8CE
MGRAAGAVDDRDPRLTARPKPERRPTPEQRLAPEQRSTAELRRAPDQRSAPEQRSAASAGRPGQRPAERLDGLPADARAAAASDPAVITANDVSDLFGLGRREARDLDASLEAARVDEHGTASHAGSDRRGRAAASAHRPPVARRTPVGPWSPERPTGRSDERSSSPKAPPRSRKRTLTTRFASVVAMGFVAMLAVATSVPSLSLLTPEEVQAMALSQTTGTTLDGQRVDISGGTLAAGIGREDYQAQTIEEYAQAAGIRAEATFTNNPLGTIQWPFAVGVHIGDRFGYRDCYGCSSDHHGQDFNPGLGAQIQAIADGVVSGSTDAGGSLGVVTMIDHVIDGQVITSVYAHMEYGSRRFEVGDTVEVGDVVGTTGNTGMSTGPHLHFEIRIGGIDGYWVDPLEWLYANTN